MPPWHRRPGASGQVGKGSVPGEEQCYKSPAPMRALAQFEDARTAEKLADALFMGDIEARVERTRDGLFTVWVLEEPRMEAARLVLTALESNPNDPRFAEMQKQAKARRAEQAKRAARESDRPSLRPSAPPVRAAEAAFGVEPIWVRAPITTALIVVCVVIYLVIEAAGRDDVAGYLWYAKSPDLARQLGFGVVDAVQGEWWRVVTPIFMHAPPGRGGTGVLHIIFNMWWLKDLGPVTERAHGKLHFVLLVLVSAAISNTAQYVTEGPHFLGMSGVVYALLGFLWTRGRFDPSVPYRLPPGLMMWMMLWFVMCWTGIMGPVANMVHAGGLVVGGLWGFLSAAFAQRR